MKNVETAIKNLETASGQAKLTFQEHLQVQSDIKLLREYIAKLEANQQSNASHA